MRACAQQPRCSFANIHSLAHSTCVYMSSRDGFYARHIFPPCRDGTFFAIVAATISRVGNRFEVDCAFAAIVDRDHQRLLSVTRAETVPQIAPSTLNRRVRHACCYRIAPRMPFLFCATSEGGPTEIRYVAGERANLCSVNRTNDPLQSRAEAFMIHRRRSCRSTAYYSPYRVHTQTHVCITCILLHYLFRTRTICACRKKPQPRFR